MAITRGKTIDRDLEKRILTALIVSTSILQKVRPLYRAQYFELTHCQKVSQWVMDYFDTYGEAPYRHFQDLFNSCKTDLSPQELEIIENFLVELSEQFVNEDGVNEAYLLDKITHYFKKQGLIRNAKELLALAEAGDVEKAELVIANFREISVSGSEWVSPFTDHAFMSRALSSDNANVLELDTIGSLVGSVKPGWLISFLGPMKRGKTWALQNIAMDLLTRKKKVCVISLEMDKLHLAPRYYMQMGNFLHVEQHERKYLKLKSYTIPSYRKFVNGERTIVPSKTRDEWQAEIRVPVFDCVKNRNNSCRKKNRTNKEPFPGVYADEVETTYTPCAVCKDVDPDFEPVVWWRQESKPLLSEATYNYRHKSFALQFPPNNLRMLSYPAYSANLRTVVQALDLLEYTEGFIPDIILIDYADILAPEDSRVTGRDAIDLTWKALKNLAATRNCVVATASQAGRRALNARTVDTTDISEDIRKLAHVDAMIGLNQTPVERDAGIMRLTCIAHRWMPSSVNRSLTVLQSLRSGQFFGDSAYGAAAFDKQTLADTTAAEEFSEDR